MPGLLIDEMSFSVDPASSMFMEPSPYLYSQQQQAHFGPFISGLSLPSDDKVQHQLPSLSILDSPSATEYPLWLSSPSSQRFGSADSSNSSLGSEAAVKELLLEAAAMVAAAATSKVATSNSPASSPMPDSPVASALHKFLPSNSSDEAGWSAEDVYSCDEFRMFEFKVRRCMRGRSHDWTECPFAHPGEKARRRDPRRFHYSGAACPDFRKGSCKNGDTCELAHGVFECWLHPARYRTQPCKDGRSCKRRVCFFAHTPEQLRLLPSASPSNSSSSTPYSSPSASMSPSPRGSGRSGDPHHHQKQHHHHHHNHHLKSASPLSSSPLPSVSSRSPTSTLVGIATSPPPLSPPLSPSGSPPHSPSEFALPSSPQRRHSSMEQTRRRTSFSSPPSSPCNSCHQQQHSPFASPCASPKSMSEIVSALHQLELNKAAAAAISSGGASSLWLQQIQQHQQQQAYSTGPSPLRPGLLSRSPSNRSTGTNNSMASSLGWDSGAMWEMEVGDEDDLEEAATPPRVESGRDLRAKIYGRLASKKVEGPDFTSPSAAAARLGINSGDELSFNSSVACPDLNWVNELLVAE